MDSLVRYLEDTGTLTNGFLIALTTIGKVVVVIILGMFIIDIISKMIEIAILHMLGIRTDRDLDREYIEDSEYADPDTKEDTNVSDGEG